MREDREWDLLVAQTLFSRKAEEEEGKKITSGLFLSAKEIVSLSLFCPFLLLNLTFEQRDREAERDASR